MKSTFKTGKGPGTREEGWFSTWFSKFRGLVSHRGVDRRQVGFRTQIGADCSVCC